MKRRDNDELRLIVRLARRAPELVPALLSSLLTSPVAEQLIWDLEEPPKVEELEALIDLGLGRFVELEAPGRPRPGLVNSPKRQPVLVGCAAAAMRLGLGIDTVALLAKKDP